MISTVNNRAVNLADVPQLGADDFYETVSERLKTEGARCVAYFAAEEQNALTLYCGIADDVSGEISLAKTQTSIAGKIQSFTPEHNAMHVYEREMHEQFGLHFAGHPWLKPLRYAEDRFDKTKIPDTYPFFSIDSEELHEVGVGPIHAGIIEPGHFRFICRGEKVLHLEIVLGYQHRGVERMMRGNPDLRKMLMAEQIAGDSTVAHALAYVAALESVAGFMPDGKLQLERCLALELERIAVHIADTSALCMDVSYQLGQVACEALRTIVINTLQLWCGNRFAKGLIRPLGTNCGVDGGLCRQIRKNINETVRRYREITSKILSLPSVLARFEDIGILTAEQAKLAGMTGMTARASGLASDVRKTHPFLYFTALSHEIVAENNGDVLARLKQRFVEVEQSYRLVSKFLNLLEQSDGLAQRPDYSPQLKPQQICCSLTEGWRGEICHTIITDRQGHIAQYKIKDPSLHNWMGLALAVRNQDISDFPICNKSFSLSYCGHDL